jgi:hypothetical protein
MPVATLSLRGVGTRDRAVVAVFAAALSVVPLSAGAAKKPAKTPVPKLDSSHLWATVDVCNTAAHPDTIGIRASMPGDGDKHETMYMSFLVEYRSSNGHWHYFGSGGQAGYAAIGDASAGTRQGGQNFELKPDFSSTQFLRGVVLFQWRLNGKVVTSTVRSTSAGHDPAAGADPPGFSATYCTIAPNSRGSLEITPVTPSAASRSISAPSSTVHT